MLIEERIVEAVAHPPDDQQQPADQENQRPGPEMAAQIGPEVFAAYVHHHEGGEPVLRGTRSQSP